MARVATNSHVAAALEYCEKVAVGQIVACQWVKLATARHLRDLERFRPKDSPFYFDEAAAERVCGIIERFPHVKGIWATHHKKLEFQAWQSFVVVSVFGWKARADKMRRFRVVYIEVPRKNAKSTLTSGVGLYLVACDDEMGAHVVSAANTRDQAKIIFTDAQTMARKESGYRARFGIEVRAHVIAQAETSSKFEAISAEYSNLDGLNLSAALIDEVHAHPSRALWDVLETAMGSRAQPLMWAVTTAGFNKAGVCYEIRGHLINVLKGTVEDDSFFGVIYTIDDGDDPFEESSWEKANPNWNVSKYPESIRSEAARARVMPSARNNFLTKHLNVWTNAAVAWLNPGAWGKLLDAALDIEDLAGNPCYLGVDLAVRVDMAALVALFPPHGLREKWAVFGKYYLPSEIVERVENAHYQGWEASGRLTVTPGAVIDYDYIIEDVLQWAARFEVREVAQDPYRATQFAVELRKRDYTGVIFDLHQSKAVMSPALKELEAMILDAKLAHDGDPILNWMVSNVMVERDSKENYYPTKESNEKKIDGVLALLMALDRANRGAAAAPDFENRGLYTV